jgi:putative transposase
VGSVLGEAGNVAALAPKAGGASLGVSIYEARTPPLERPRRDLILRVARENAHWGYQRIAGELKRLRLAVSATTVRKVLTAADLPPGSERGQQTWRSFLRQQAASTLACDFFTVETLGLQRIYVLFFISLATRRLEFIACTQNPDRAWVAQQARNLVMELGEQGGASDC